MQSGVSGVSGVRSSLTLSFLFGAKQANATPATCWPGQLPGFARIARISTFFATFLLITFTYIPIPCYSRKKV
jgi:hypothetical protein